MFFMTDFTFVTSIILGNLFICLLVALRKNKKVIANFTTFPMILAIILCILRLLLTVEIDATIEIESEVIYAGIYSFFKDNYLFGIKYLYILYGTWVLGMVVAVCKHFANCLMFKKWQATLEPVENPIVYEALEVVLEKFGKYAKVKLLTADSIRVPMISGFFKPVIYLPKMDFTQEELEHILTHELTHYFNKDVWIKLGIWINCIVFWFNPLVYILKKNTSEILELACDNRVTKNVTNKEKVAYLKTILRVVEENASKDCKQNQVTTVSALFDDSSESLIEERFRIVLDDNAKELGRKGKILTSSIMIMLFLASYSIVLQPSYPDGPKDEVTYDLFSEDNYLIEISDGVWELYSGGELAGLVDNEVIKIVPFCNIVIKD